MASPAVASASWVSRSSYRQMRLTLAVAFVRPGDKTLAIVQCLLQCAAHFKVRIDVLYPDRGFCSGPVIAYLTAVRQRAILACTIRGKMGGTRQLCRGRTSYRTHYTFTDGTSAEMVVDAPRVADKTQRKGRICSTKGFRNTWSSFDICTLACEWVNER